MWEDRFPRLWAVLEKASVLVLGTLLFLLVCLPVFTIPAAICGLYRALRPMATGSRGELMADFWGGFKEGLKPGLVFGVINFVYLAGCALWVAMLWPQPSLLLRVVAWLFIWLVVFGLMVNVYTWPVLAWYPQPGLQALKRGALLALAHPLWALGAVLAPLAVLLAAEILLPPVVFLGAAIMAGPAVLALASAAVAWRVMKRYAPPDEFPEGPDPWEEPGPGQRSNG